MANNVRDFIIDRTYLNVPIRNEAKPSLLRILIDGEIIREFTASLAPDPGNPDYWVFVDVGQFNGKTVKVSIDSLNPENQKGFEAIFQDDTFPGKDEVYREKHRPQFHFSSVRGWNNDPNGMMYYAGEYHLFYQHNPYGWGHGNMTWGHAISMDLVHWEESGDVLHPDALGTMYSGSGVVDWNNTTGFQTGDEPPLVTIYTSAGGTNPLSEGQPSTQCIAYSNDRGRTWTKYDGNPVQGQIDGGNRDPKVIWWEETREWVIVLYLVDSRMGIFRSPDLKHWELQSVLPAFHECPELFQLLIDGDQANKRWILYGASGDYYLGDFDGSEFKPEDAAIKFNYGDAFYASQTFSDIPETDGRRIQIAWGQVPTPGMPFNQMMTFPTTLSLRNTSSGIRMCAQPVEEIKRLYKNSHTIRDVALEPGSDPLSGITGDTFDIRAEISVDNSASITLGILEVPVTYNAQTETITCKNKEAPCLTIGGKIKLQILVDRTSIEIFINDGEYYMPMASIPDDSSSGLKLSAEGGSAHIVSLAVHELVSIWE